MAEYAVYQLDAFTLGPEHPFSGNPAAVCLLQSWLDDGVMQAIAAENNLSETAFCVATDAAHELRWFTPRVEVPLCGHATMATAWVVFHKTTHFGDTVTFRTKSGPLTVIRSGERLSMDFPALRTRQHTVPDALARALGAVPMGCRRGDTDYVAIFESEDEIRGLKPDFAAIGALDRPGLIVTAPGRDCDFVSRYFAPAKGVNEDPVTGRAHCVLAPYWSERLARPVLDARQLSPRGGAVGCTVAGDRIILTGQVTPFLEGVIRL
ncbi:MAG: PhzF family phenazine biosynthesis protein [Alphaproteobacteria bacterium]